MEHLTNENTRSRDVSQSPAQDSITSGRRQRGTTYTEVVREEEEGEEEGEEEEEEEEKVQRHMKPPNEEEGWNAMQTGNGMWTLVPRPTDNIL